MDRAKMVQWLADNVKEWPNGELAVAPVVLPKSWNWHRNGTSWYVIAQGFNEISVFEWQRACAAQAEQSRQDVLAHYRKRFQHWPTCLEDVDGHLDYLPGWSWSLDAHGFMKLGDITYLDFYDVLPREWMIKHLEANLNEWPCGLSKVRVALDGTGWAWNDMESVCFPRDLSAAAIQPRDVGLPAPLAEPRKSEFIVDKRSPDLLRYVPELPTALAELLQCGPDQVLDTVRNLMPDWHTVPKHVDLLQVVWSHAQGHKQPRQVFLHRPKAPVDQETVNDLLARFDKDSLLEAFSK